MAAATSAAALDLCQGFCAEVQFHDVPADHLHQAPPPPLTD